MEPSTKEILELRQQNKCLCELLELCNFEVPGEAEKAISTLKIARSLKLKRWETKCVQVLQEKLTTGNVIPLYVFASDKDNPVEDLKKAAFDYILNNFMQIFKLEDFKQLGLSDVTQILETNELKVEKEEEVFQAAVSWVSAEKASRTKLMESLIPVVRLPLCDSRFLNTLKDHYLLHDLGIFQKELSKVTEDSEKEPQSQEFRVTVERLKRTPRP